MAVGRRVRKGIWTGVGTRYRRGKGKWKPGFVGER